ncbi:unnamed protein product [Moneuplotes crassus]|uniref:histidine kinase n=1 Tax=Euplotes crassus TaxID=5936 RepID=A0AAD1XUN8_EUPCR|nr:unnamed protein product [Moneuplotes crassus]
MLVTVILFLSVFQGIVEKSEMAAKYSGTILSIIVIFGITEINVNLGQYRLYEAFMGQIALSFLMSTCMSTNWIAATLCLLLSYAYYCTRMITTFDDVPNELFIGLLEASSLYALGAYLSSRTLHRELSANFKAKESSKEFKKFLKCVPEGVSIVDHEFMELKFYNSKLREAFDINRYCDSGAELAEFNDLKSSIDQEFSQALKKMAKNSCENSVGNKPFKSLMKKFKIIKESDIGSFEPLDEEDKNVEDQLDQPLLEKKQKLGSPEDKNLFEFLYQERETLKRENAKEKESKVSLYFNDFNFIDGIEISKREFVIKTRSVSRNDTDSPKSSMYLHIFSDTTQITQLEEQKAQNRYQKQMLANVSHEFRTPLNAMSLSLVLLRKKIGGPYAKLLKIASSSCNILNFLVEDILDHAKIESGVFEIQPEVFKVSKIIEEVEEIFELQALQKRISLKFHVEKEIECIKIETDKQRIKQVMMNLLSNALKFTDRGEIKVFLERLIGDHKDSSKSREEDKVDHDGKELHFIPNRMNESYSVEITPRPQIPRVSHYERYPDNNDKSSYRGVIQNPHIDPYRKLKLKLTVEDSGIGIPLSDQSSLFKLFGKTSSNHNRNKTGCGLGLTICRKILQKLGGDITLESEEGKGTKFTCIFECKY